MICKFHPVIREAIGSGDLKLFSCRAPDTPEWLNGALKSSLKNSNQFSTRH